MKNKLEHTPATVILNRWSAFLSKRHLCQNHDDIDNIHDLRVATRRLRAVIQLFAPFCSAGDFSAVYPEVKSVTREIGVLRNVDEVQQFIKTSCLPSEDCAGLFELPLHRLSIQRNQEAEKVHKILKQLDVSSMQVRLKHIARHLPESDSCCCNGHSGQKLVSFLSDYNLKLFQQVQAHIGPSSAPEAVEQRHALRISIKKWRYFVEILSELTNRDYTHILTNLRFYQSLLGSLNDMSVFCEILKDLGLNDIEQDIVLRRISQTKNELYRNFSNALIQQPIRYEFLL